MVRPDHLRMHVSGPGHVKRVNAPCVVSLEKLAAAEAYVTSKAAAAA